MNSGTRLQPQAYDRLHNVIEQVYEIEHPDDFPRILSLLNQLVRSDYLAIVDVPRSKLKQTVVKDGGPFNKVAAVYRHSEPSTQLVSAHTRYVHQHPFLIHFKKTQNGHAYTISDFLNRKQFHQLDLYNAYFRQMGVESQINFFLDIGHDSLTGVSLNRSKKDFSEEDRLMLNLIRPHLVRAYRNAMIATRCRQERTLLESAIEQEGRGVIQVGRNGAIQSITAFAGSLLASYFSLSSQGNRLPLLLQKWLEGMQTAGRQAQDQAFTLEKDKKSLFIQALFTKESECLILLLKEESASSIKSAEAFGLTPREAEVLHWVAMGKTNREVGIILGIRTGTVKNHLGSIYEKLGVETRTAAASIYQSFSQVSRDMP